MKKFLPQYDPKTILAVIWLVMSALIIILLVLFSVRGVFYEPVRLIDPCQTPFFISQEYYDEVGECRIPSKWLYDDKSELAWEWLMPMIIPTASLIISSIIFEAQSETKYQVSNDSKLFYVTISITVFYLSLLAFTVLACGFVGEGKVLATEWLSVSTSWLLPIQGLVVALMGAYFIDRREKPSEDEIAPLPKDAINQSNTSD